MTIQQKSEYHIRLDKISKRTKQKGARYVFVMSLFQVLVREEQFIVHTVRLNAPAVGCVVCVGLGILQNDGDSA